MQPFSCMLRRGPASTAGRGIRRSTFASGIGGGRAGAMRYSPVGGDWETARLPGRLEAMSTRIRYREIAPDIYRTLSVVQAHVRASGLDAKLVELVYLRVSQVNVCAFCVHMHAKALRAAGETDARIDGLVVWREAPFFTPRERVALDWAEAVTRLGPDHISDPLYLQALREFGDKDLAELTLAVIAINAWNRMAIAFRSSPVEDAPPVDVQLP